MSEQEQDVVVVDDDQNAGNPEVERKAREFGWVPKDEYKGDPEQYRDAEEFLRRGEEVIGFVRKDLDKALQRNSKYEREIADLRATMEEFRKYHNETEARAYKRAFDDLKVEKAKAVEQGDGERVIEIEDQIELLKESQKRPSQAPQKAQPPILFTPDELRGWQSKNTWYGQDQALSEFADEVADVLLVKEPELKGVEFLEKLTKRVRAAYPEAFENPNRNNSIVSGGGDVRPTQSGKKKSYENLPADAKAACDKFVKQGLLTREQYVKEYDWD